jgi:hypothetical protein
MDSLATQAEALLAEASAYVTGAAEAAETFEEPQ